MIVGRSTWGYTGNVFKISPCITNINSMKVQNAIFDEIKVDTTVDEVYSSLKDEWSYDTVLLATFDGTLEAGDVNNNGISIQKILFQKRKIEDYEWTTVAEFDYDSTKQLYEFLDTYVQNYCPYEYAVIPLTSSVTGNRVTQTITPQFDKVFLCDKNTNIGLFLDTQLGDFEYNNPSYIYEPIGGTRYPIVGYSSLNYKKGNVKAFILSDTDVQQNDINPYTEKQNRDRIINFLNNHKPKLLRTANSEFIMINIVNNLKFTPENSLLGVVGNVSFDFVEVDNVDNNSLTSNGFI